MSEHKLLSDADLDGIDAYCIDCGRDPDQPHHRDCIVSKLDNARDPDSAERDKS